MAYADIGDIATGAVISEAYLDQIRANFQAGVPDIFTTKGDIAVATAASDWTVYGDRASATAWTRSTGRTWGFGKICE